VAGRGFAATGARAGVEAVSPRGAVSAGVGISMSSGGAAMVCFRAGEGMGGAGMGSGEEMEGGSSSLISAGLY